MIELNKIGLNQVQLNRLYLNTLSSEQRIRSGGGTGDGFPVLPGDVTRWHFGGLTNEIMAAMDDPRIEDADHKGRFLSFKNFAWKGMSGVGGYVGDFSKWVNNRDTTEIGITKSNSKVIIDVKVSQGSGKNIVFISKSNLGISNNVTIKITSTYPEGVMKFANSASNKYLKLPSNGIITLQDNPEYTSNEMHLHLASADLGQITIEQLPLYPGALVFDGVDDYGVCDNFPILTKEKGYTVIGLRHILNDAPGAWISKRTVSPETGAFTVDLKATNLVSYANTFGKSNIVSINKNNAFVYQTSTSYMENPIIQGENPDSNALVIGAGLLTLSGGSIVGTREYVKCSIHELVILDHDATEEELTKIKNYFIKTYPWLFPDQAWTVTGKTNEDEGRATIANITGNGNDLILSNFGFIEGSGYNEEGEYAGYLVTDGVDDKITSSAFKMGKDWTVVGDWKFINDESKNAGIIKPSSLYVYNALNGVSIFINSGSIGNNIKENKGFNAICSNGRAYDRNWTEYSELKVEKVTKSNSELKIGASSNDTNYTRMVFKNFAIYPKVLSKDDCVKAYNYLQTLKAK